MVEPTLIDSGYPKNCHWLDALTALVTAWSRPAATTRSTNSVPLSIAYAVHCIAAFGFILSVTLIEALGPHHNEDVSYLALWMVGIDSLLAESFRYPFGAAMIVGACEAAILCLAILLAPWSAQDEPLANSFRHALRRTWLHCGHVVVVTLLAGGVVVAIGHVERRQRDGLLVATEHLVYPTYPANPTKPEIAKYNSLVQKYRAQYEAIEAQHPPRFLARNSDRIYSFAIMAGGIWILAALMRGVAADRPHRRQSEHVLCRECGYNLIATDPHSRCPECGRPVRLTLDPPSEQAPRWQRAKILSHLPVAYMATLWRAATRSNELAFGLSNLPENNRYRWYLGVNLILSAIISLSVLWFVFAPEDDEWVDLAWIVAPWLAVSWVAIMLSLLLLCALIVGIAIRIRTGRNQLAAVNQLACYLSGHLVAWSFILGIMIVAIVRWNDLFRAWCREMGLSADTLISAGIGTLILILFVRLLFKLWRASNGVRYLMSLPNDAMPAIGDAPDNLT